MDILYIAEFCYFEEVPGHGTPLGQFRVSIHDCPSIPRRIDANVTGVTAVLSNPYDSSLPQECIKKSSLPQRHSQVHYVYFDTLILNLFLATAHTL